MAEPITDYTPVIIFIVLWLIAILWAMLTGEDVRGNECEYPGEEDQDLQERFDNYFNNKCGTKENGTENATEEDQQKIIAAWLFVLYSSREVG